MQTQSEKDILSKLNLEARNIAVLTPKPNRNKGHFILIKEIIHQEDIAVLNICIKYLGTFNFIKQILSSKTQMNTNTITVGNFNTPLSPTDMTFC